MFLKYLNNEKGFAFPLALMILLVLGILIVPAVNFSSADQRHSILQDHKMQAHYLARSGAEALESYIVDNPDSISMDEMEEEFKANSDPVKLNSLDIGYFTTLLIPINENNWDVESTGYVGNEKDTVRLSIVKTTDSTFNSFNHALFASNLVSFEGSTKIIGSVASDFTDPLQVSFNSSGEQYIDGDLYVMDPIITKENINYGTKITGEVINMEDPMTFPIPTFPAFPALPKYPKVSNPFSIDGRLTLSGGSPYTLDLKTNEFKHDYYFSEVNVKSNLTLNIDIGAEDRTLVINKLNVPTGHIKIIGTGKLTLYIEDSITLGSGSTINAADKINQLEIYLRGSSTPKTLIIAGDQKIFGSLFAENANIELTNGGDLMGNIIALGGSVIMSGAATAVVRAIYAPNAIVKLDAGAYVTGSIIARELRMTGNTTLKYSQVSGSEFLDNNLSTTTYKKGIWKRD